MIRPVLAARRMIGPALASVQAGITYLLLDQFVTDDAAPLASPRTCEPGPGTLTAVQTDGQLSISGGVLNFPAQTTPTWGDQGFYGAGLARVAGRVLLATINWSTRNDFGIGWHNAAALVDASTLAGGALRITNVPDMRWSRAGASAVVTTSISAATAYQHAIVQRATGAFFLIKGGVFSEWTVLWIDNAGSNATLYPEMSNYSAVGTLDNLRVTDLPSPWTDDYGIATQRLAGSVANGTGFTHEADSLIEFTITTLQSSGNSGIRFRVQDASNYWRVRSDSAGELQLRETVAGVDTIRGTASGVITNGDRIVVVASGTTIRVYEANTLRITYSSATNFQTQTSGEVNVGTGGVISDVISWPRTLSGAALSALNAV